MLLMRSDWRISLLITGLTCSVAIINRSSGFLQVRVDVSSRMPGQIRASYVEGPRRTLDGLVLEPLREENYYEASH